MAEQFLHGVEVLDIDGGARPTQTVKSSVIGIVGTAPRADAAAFPLNTPVMVANSRTLAAKLLSSSDDSDGDGTLPDALDSIFDQAGAAVIVVRVEQGTDASETLANIIGGVNSGTGQHEGLHALTAAENIVGFRPRILIAPGFTHQRVVDGITAFTMTNQGSGYAVPPTVTVSGGGGAGVTATAVLGTGANAGKVVDILVNHAGSGFTSNPAVAFANAATLATGTAALGSGGDAGKVVSIAVTNGGTGYTSAPTVTLSGGSGTGATATAVLGSGETAGQVIAINVTAAGADYVTAPAVALAGGQGSGAAATASFGTTGNPVVAELIGIAERMRAVIIADGPSTTDAAAIAYAGDFGSKRVYVVDPRALKTDSDGQTATTYSSAHVAGLLSKSDNDRGWWWSPSNQNVNGIIGTERAVDFAMGDVNSRANLLNEKNVATIIRQNGFRLWGNRTLSADPKWQFLCVVRTADIIADSLQAAHLWAVDRGITKTYVEEVREGVNAYLRHLKALGAIIGGECWLDPELNTPEQIAQGKVYWDFDFTPVYPAEHLTFRSHLVNNYIVELF